jgi:hypothetical protein
LKWGRILDGGERERGKKMKKIMKENNGRGNVELSNRWERKPRPSCREVYHRGERRESWRKVKERERRSVEKEGEKKE